MRKYVKAFRIWLLLTPIGILNGGLRIYITEPLFGNFARPLSGIILSIMIFAVAYFLIPKIGKAKPIEYIGIGIGWAILTNIFDIVVNKIENRPFSDFLEMYDITTGNLWILVVIVTLTAPISVWKIKKKNNKQSS